MTTASVPVIEQSYEVPTERDVSEGGGLPRVAFPLNGQLFTVVRPKLAIATAMMRLMERPSDAISDYAVSIINVLHTFVNYIEIERGKEPALDDDGHVRVFIDKDGKRHTLGGLTRGRQRIIERLDDPTDALDVMDLYDPFKAIVEAMFTPRPTGPSPASSPVRRKSAGRSSRGTTRSTPAKTSSTSRRTSSSSRAKAM
jgi:hypothetical protein